MRADMAKVLIEDARTQSAERSRKWGKRLKYDPDSDYDDEPKKIKSSRYWQYGYNHKNSTDVLGPLKGFLKSRVGQPWDDVYSEICRNLDRRSVTGLHVFTHLWQFVDLNCWIGAKTGKVYCNGKWGHSQPTDFYVHPWTGVLCEVPRRSRQFWRKNRTKRDPVKFIPINDSGYSGTAYQNLEGIWYYTEWAKEEREATYNSYSRLVGRNPWSVKEEMLILKKRQLSKKELRDLKLCNYNQRPPKAASLALNGGQK